MCLACLGFMLVLVLLRIAGVPLGTPFSDPKYENKAQQGRKVWIAGTIETYIKEIAFDRWGAVQMVQNLEGMGFTVVPFGQGYKDMSPPTKELMKLTLEERIAHGGHKVLRWMMDNVFVRQDPAGNIKMDKEKSTEKIDGAVATVMALDRAIRNEGSDGSVYDDRGILVF